MPRTVADLDWPRRTDRLALRPATPADLRAVYDIRSQPEVGRWMPDLPTSYDAWLVRQGQAGGIDKMLVVLLGEEVIGHLHLGVSNA